MKIISSASLAFCLTAAVATDSYSADDRCNDILIESVTSSTVDYASAFAFAASGELERSGSIRKESGLTAVFGKLGLHTDSEVDRSHFVKSVNSTDYSFSNDLKTNFYSKSLSNKQSEVWLKCMLSKNSDWSFEDVRLTGDRVISGIVKYAGIAQDADHSVIIIAEGFSNNVIFPDKPEPNVPNIFRLEIEETVFEDLRILIQFGQSSAILDLVNPRKRFDVQLCKSPHMTRKHIDDLPYPNQPRRECIYTQGPGEFFPRSDDIWNLIRIVGGSCLDRNSCVQKVNYTPDSICVDVHTLSPVNFWNDDFLESYAYKWVVVDRAIDGIDAVARCKDATFGR